MQSAPLTPYISNAQNGTSKSTLPLFPEFRTNATGASIPVFGASGAGATVSVALHGWNILWDTGAYGQASVSPSVFTPYQAYFNASLAKVRHNYQFEGF